MSCHHRNVFHKREIPPLCVHVSHAIEKNNFTPFTDNIMCVCTHTHAPSMPLSDEVLCKLSSYNDDTFFRWMIAEHAREERGSIEKVINVSLCPQHSSISSSSSSMIARLKFLLEFNNLRGFTEE